MLQRVHDVLLDLHDDVVSRSEHVVAVLELVVAVAKHVATNPKPVAGGKKRVAGATRQIVPGPECLGQKLPRVAEGAEHRMKPPELDQSQGAALTSTRDTPDTRDASAPAPPPASSGGPQVACGTNNSPKAFVAARRVPPSPIPPGCQRLRARP